MNNHLKSDYSGMVVLDVTPESANWAYLSFRIVRIRNKEVYLHRTRDTELALVPLAGAGTVQTAEGEFPLSRAGVFQEKSSALYIPPGHEFAVITAGNFEFAVGAAPAEGKYPLACSRRTRSNRRCAVAAQRDGRFITLSPILCRQSG